MKSRNLNFLEPSGPLQACNGTALPFYQYKGLLVNGTEEVIAAHAENTGNMRSNLVGK